MRLKELNVRPEADGRVIIPAEVLESIGTDADSSSPDRGYRAA